MNDLVRLAMFRAVRDFNPSLSIFNLAQFGIRLRELSGHEERGLGLDGRLCQAVLTGRSDCSPLAGGSHYQLIEESLGDEEDRKGCDEPPASPHPCRITPKIGQTVWYWPDNTENREGGLDGDGPLAAIICCVWTYTCVNLVVFDLAGEAHRRRSITLLQPEDKKPDGGAVAFCVWPEFAQ